MKQQLTQKINQIKDIMTQEESTVSDPETKSMIHNHIVQIDELDKKFGVNFPLSGIYRLEVIRKNGGGRLFRARKGYEEKRTGFYLGHADAVKQFINTHPDIVFTNKEHFGF